MQIWAQSQDIKGTLAELYLRSRGVSSEIPAMLRFHPRCPRGRDERLPAMVGLFVDITSNEPCGIHRTYLDATGRGKVETGTQKMMLGRTRGAVLKLTPDDAVTIGLSIAEGIETALTLLDGGLNVWATGSAGGISAFPVLAGIESLSVFADHDPVGLAAATTCAERWSTAGIESRVVYPRIPRTDFNDIVRAETHD